MVKPEIQDAQPNASLSLRSMPFIAERKTAERLPATRVSGIVNDIFEMTVKEDEIMNIIHLPSKHLGPAYLSIVRRIRISESSYTDKTSCC